MPDKEKTWEFQCINKRCMFKAVVDIERVKLLRTDVVDKKGVVKLSWIIYTCPNCHETYMMMDRRNFLYELAPIVRIEQPKYEGVK